MHRGVTIIAWVWIGAVACGESVEPSAEGALALTEPSVGPVEPSCSFNAGVSRGTVRSRELREISGVVASRRNPGVLWAHNDAGNPSKIYALGTNGADLGAVTFSGATLVDAEDIAIGAGPDPRLSYVYVGDIGDNDMRRPEVAIYRFAEPHVATSGQRLAMTLRPHALHVTYPNGPRNAEALLLDPIAFDLLLVTKSSNRTEIYRVSAAFEDGERVIAERVGSLATVGGAVSGGDISPAGTELIIRTDRAAMWWQRDPSMTIAETVARASCPVPTRNESNGEALGFAADARGYFTISEGNHPPVYYFSR